MLRMETTLPTRQHHILECLNPYTFTEINLLFLTTHFAPSVPQSVLLDVKLNTTYTYVLKILTDIKNMHLNS